MPNLHNYLLIGAGALALLAPAYSQMLDNQDKTMTCDEHNHWNHLASHCEIKEQVMPSSRGAIEINPGTNGGVTIKGWNRSDMLVRAKIETAAPSDAEARGMVGQIRFANGSGHIAAEGPNSDSDHNWSVSYEIFMPHQSDFTATTHNGGVHIQDVKGVISFNTTNGGVHLARLAGHVTGRTTNGGVHVVLAGDRWDGEGLDVETTNGGIHMNVPSAYSAHVETSTVNGGLHVDFPVTVQGHITKNLAFDIGSGGPTVRVTTTNGGVQIQKT
jgi:DUF4097 and DUF4098 domain-containing protein YvlB